VFDDMLKKPCPYHKTPVNHTLEQCNMLKKYYSRAIAKDGKAKKDGSDGDAGGFPNSPTSSTGSGYLIPSSSTMDPNLLAGSSWSFATSTTSAWTGRSSYIHRPMVKWSGPTA
jgi:hypothetical protein